MTFQVGDYAKGMTIKGQKREGKITRVNSQTLVIEGKDGKAAIMTASAEMVAKSETEGQVGKKPTVEQVKAVAVLQTCKECGKEQPFTEFQRTRKEGVRRTICKTCTSKKRKQAAQHPPLLREKDLPADLKKVQVPKLEKLPAVTLPELKLPEMKLPLNLKPEAYGLPAEEMGEAATKQPEDQKQHRDELDSMAYAVALGFDQIPEMAEVRMKEFPEIGDVNKLPVKAAAVLPEKEEGKMMIVKKREPEIMAFPINRGNDDYRELAKHLFSGVTVVKEIRGDASIEYLRVGGKSSTAGHHKWIVIGDNPEAGFEFLSNAEFEHRYVPVTQEGTAGSDPHGDR